MQDRDPVQFFHYPHIAHHRCHRLSHFRFQVYCNAGVVQEAKVAEKQVEQEEGTNVTPNVTPNASPHSRILHFNFLHYVPRKLKFIYWINV
jgi:hypothetical protein